jgi:hypothetical protein
VENSLKLTGTRNGINWIPQQNTLRLYYVEDSTDSEEGNNDFFRYFRGRVMCMLVLKGKLDGKFW